MIILWILAFVVFMWALGRYVNPHMWTYRNPFDRRCTVCGRHEVMHEYFGNPADNRWDVFSDGDTSAHSINK